jgi:hypothetical protein
MKPIDLQLSYKKVVCFTERQRIAFKKLEDYDVNVNKFIRDAIAEKLKRDWKMIKEKKTKFKVPF